MSSTSINESILINNSNILNEYKKTNNRESREKSVDTTKLVESKRSYSRDQPKRVPNKIERSFRNSSKELTCQIPSDKSTHKSQSNTHLSSSALNFNIPISGPHSLNSLKSSSSKLIGKVKIQIPSTKSVIPKFKLSSCGSHSEHLGENQSECTQAQSSKNIQKSKMSMTE